jgi:hypothetical protein
LTANVQDEAKEKTANRSRTNAPSGAMEALGIERAIKPLVQVKQQRWR